MSDKDRAYHRLDLLRAKHKDFDGFVYYAGVQYGYLVFHPKGQ